jgi:hypothetical protein
LEQPPRDGSAEFIQTRIRRNDMEVGLVAKRAKEEMAALIFAQIGS